MLAADLGGRPVTGVPLPDGSPGQKQAALPAFPSLARRESRHRQPQPEDDLDNRWIYDLIVRRIGERQRSRQVIAVAHNPDIVVSGGAEAAIALDFRGGQCIDA